MATSVTLADSAAIAALASPPPASTALQGGLGGSITVDGSQPPLDLLAFWALATAVVGALLLWRAPEYLDRTVHDLRHRPGQCFLGGLLAVICQGLAVLVLSGTDVGIAIAVPLYYGFLAVGTVGTVLGYVAVVDGLGVDRGMSVLFAAVAVACMAVLPLVVGVLSFLVGTAGIGAILRDWGRDRPPGIRSHPATE